MMRASMVVLGLVLASFGVGCVTSNASTCNDRVCPSGTTCVASVNRCVDFDLVAACRDAADGQGCTVAGMPPAKCLGSICQASRCGDGRITGAEECDGDKLAGRTCQTLGFYVEAGLRCEDSCKFDTSLCTGQCGDGKKNGSEQCDGEDLGGATCLTAGYYKAPGLACKSDCTFDIAACQGGRCGDGVVNGLEQCDAMDLGGMSCKKLGYDFTLNGLSCSSSCTFAGKSCRCNAGERCDLATQTCACDKLGCGCVAKPRR